MNQVRQIGLRIAYFRKMRKLTQAELANRVHMNKSYLSQIECRLEKKSLSLPLLISIADKLNISLSILVKMDDVDDSFS